jgi:hypothetical protein
MVMISGVEYDGSDGSETKVEITHLDTVHPWVIGECEACGVTATLDCVTYPTFLAALRKFGWKIHFVDGGEHVFCPSPECQPAALYAALARRQEEDVEFFGSQAEGPYQIEIDEQVLEGWTFDEKGACAVGRLLMDRGKMVSFRRNGELIKDLQDPIMQRVIYGD